MKFMMNENGMMARDHFYVIYQVKKDALLGLFRLLQTAIRLYHI